MIRRAAPCLLAFPLLLGAGPGEEPEPPADPRVRERIEAWGRDLSSSAYARREEAAKRLCEAGGDAVWLLRTISAGSDPEASERAREILASISWAPPSLRKRIDEAVEVLKNPKDPAAWSEALGLLKDGLGEPAHKALRDLFPDIHPDPKDFEMTIDPKGDLYAPGAEIPFRVRIVNRGKEPVWIRSAWFRATVGRERIAEAIPADQRSLQQIDRKAVLTLRPAQGSADLVYVEPGEAFEQDLCVEGGRADFTGRARLAVTYMSMGRPKKRGAFPAGVPDVHIPKGADYSRIFAWATELSISAESPPVYLLAPRAGGPDAPFSIEAKPAGEGGAGGALSVELALSGRRDPGVPLAAPGADGTAAQGFWALLLDGEGRPADLVPFAEDPYAERTVVLKKGSPLRLKGSFRTAAPPGDYRLQVGYSAAVQKLNGAVPPRPPGAPALWTGTVVSEAVPLRIR